MARKTKNNLVYVFIPFGAERSYYKLLLKIVTLTDEQENQDEEESKLRELIRDLNNFLMEKMLVIWFR